MQVRPNGSPPTDSSLKALGMHLLHADAATGGISQQSQQVDPFLRHDRFKLEQPSRSSVSVLLQTQVLGALGFNVHLRM